MQRTGERSPHGQPAIADHGAGGAAGGADAAAARVCVCVLNWNGWRDTVECLESLLRATDPRFQIVVLDNGSTDDSLARIGEWADGRLDHPVPPSSPLARSASPVPRPLRWRAVERGELASLPPSSLAGAQLLLVANGENLGFAAGLNVGIDYAARAGSFDYAWLLNNDTVVRPDALLHLVRRMRAEPQLGLCGSTLLFYDEPERVQALGGFRYNQWLGYASQIGQLAHVSELTPARAGEAERAMFGVQGASILASMRLIRRVGGLSEEFFLYFEEQDWAVRARRAGFRLGYAPDSVVYHKEGRSTGNNSLRHTERSAESDFFQLQARLLFTRKHFPLALPAVYASLVGVVANRVRRRQLGRVGMVGRLALRVLVDPVARRPDGGPVARRVGAPADRFGEDA